MAIKFSTAYVPSFLRNAMSSSRARTMTFSDVADTNILSTSSFAYDSTDAPLKSTQQLNVDWSQFHNHTFFSSAETNVNIAFDQIINGYPFDGTKVEVERFFEGLSGFEKWVFDQFPKYRGSLGFSNSWISVVDRAGALYPDISKNKSGDSVLNPLDGKSLTIEMLIYVPTVANANQVICQKASTARDAISLHLLQTSATSSCDVEFTAASGSSFVSTRGTLQKGVYNHLCAVLDRDNGPASVELFLNGETLSVSRTSVTFGNFDISSALFNVGSGSAVTAGSFTYTPTATFSGSLDELRLWHTVRTPEQQIAYHQKSVFANENLKLYFRFNEPRPLLGASAGDAVNTIVLDSSGNALHTLITNFDASLRENLVDHPENPMIFERPESTPVLFPAYSSILDLSDNLLASASAYDTANPNLITRLIPAHYLEQGAALEGLMTIDSVSTPHNTGSGLPGENQIGSAQLITSFLYIWAKFFDDVKLYVDTFSNIEHVDYTSFETTPDNFLARLVRQYGFNLPPLFTNATLDQFVNGGQITEDASILQAPLKFVQQQLLRRVLINMPDVLRSKGTQHSIKSFLRAIGIDPENSMRIREYGGPTEKQLDNSREVKSETNYMAFFESTSSYAYSPFLSASRIETGFPQSAGAMVQKNIHPPHGISNNVNDGLLTSGSWTVEGIVKFPFATAASRTNSNQSLVRMCVSGTNSANGGMMFNLVANSSTLTLFGRPGNDISSPLLKLELDLAADENTFNSEHWSFSFGRQRSDELGTSVSSSYFLRAGRSEDGSIKVAFATSSFFYEKSSVEQDAQSAMLLTSSSPNVTAPFLAFGPGQSIASGSGAGFVFLNNTAIEQAARTTDFNGWLSNVRFWSKYLTNDEWPEHIKNYKTTGVEDPKTNYNFATTPTGSFGRLRMDAMSRQAQRSAPSGLINFLDYSLNNNHLTGSGFSTGSNVLRGELFSYSYLSPYFDESATNEKVRIRGYQNLELVLQTPWANFAPVYEVPKSEQPTDDVRFTVDFSLVDALNRDIVLMFSSFDAMDNAIGDPSLMFSPDYPDLERMRDVYFNRIQEKLNFKKFFEFFRWFDSTLGVFIAQLVPRKTRFDGTNFSIESHMLERHKLEYRFNEIYLGDTERNIDNVLLLQFVEGDLRKY